MNVRIVRWCLLVGASLVLPAAAQSQDSVTRQEFTELKTRLEAVENKANSPEAVPRQDDEAKTKALERRVETLEGNTRWLVDIANDQRAVLGDIAKGVAQGGTNKWIPDIRGAMENPQFQADMDEAVHRSMHQRGTLMIENRMSTYQSLRVNGNTYQVAPQGSLSIDLPVGTVTTELVGYESPKNWTIGPPSYRLSIGIGPTTVHRVYMASSPPVVERTSSVVYYSPPAADYSPSVVYYGAPAVHYSYSVPTYVEYSPAPVVVEYPQPVWPTVWLY